MLQLMEMLRKKSVPAFFIAKSKNCIGTFVQSCLGLAGAKPKPDISFGGFTCKRGRCMRQEFPAVAQIMPEK